MKVTSTKREITKRLLLLLGALVVLYLMWVLVWAAIKPQLIKHNVPVAFRQLYGEVPPLPSADLPIPIHKGNINGVPIAVPSNYFKFAFAYNDKSIWEPRKPGDKKMEERTFADTVGSFALLVRWPDMKPRSPETEKSFWNHDKPGGDAWLMIGVNSDPVGGPRSSNESRNGLARMLRGMLERLSEEGLAEVPRYIVDPTDPDGKRRIRTMDVRYVLRGTDPVTGLQWAEPVGPGTERFHAWNMVLYWQGDMDGTVTDLIECYNGKIPNSNSYQKCEHRFGLPEWGASISFDYPRTLLPQWRELKARTRELILGFQVSPEAEEMTMQTTTNKEHDK